MSLCLLVQADIFTADILSSGLLSVGVFWSGRFTSIIPLVHHVSTSIAAQDYPIERSEDDACHDRCAIDSL